MDNERSPAQTGDRTFVEGIDFYFEEGLMVLTRKYLLERGSVLRQRLPSLPLSRRESRRLEKEYIDLGRFKDAVYPIARASKLAAEISVLVTNRNDDPGAATRRVEFDRAVAEPIYMLEESLRGWNAIVEKEAAKAR